MNCAQSDSSSNAVAAAVAHAGLLQPISMQNLLAMAGLGQSTLSPTSSNQSINAAQLNTAATPLCKFRYLCFYFTNYEYY